MVQDVVLASAGTTPLIFFDVGANVGAWSKRLLGEARIRKVMVKVHAFEPSEPTFARLVMELLGEFNDEVVAVHTAVSDHAGQASLYKVHELAGSNSLHRIAGSADGLLVELVDLITLDDYCERGEIESIDLLKIDAEGHDFLVLTGARRLLQSHNVQALQFEYNYRWIGSRHYLKDVFDILLPIGYRIGKITPGAIEWYPRWTPELETFCEANYLAALPSLSNRFSVLGWWNARAGEQL
jgi:FkbM family methyltransferase